MKRRHIIAIAIGALVSMILLAIPSGRHGTSAWAYLEAPGIIAIMLVWGPHGPAPDILSLAVAWAVNAILYGVVALAVLSVFKISN